LEILFWRIDAVLGSIYLISHVNEQLKKLFYFYYNGCLVNLQTDGYAGYNEVCKQNNLIHVGCWYHARRKFREAKDGQPKDMKGK
jgi:hypothetical protein